MEGLVGELEGWAGLASPLELEDDSVVSLTDGAGEPLGMGSSDLVGGAWSGAVVEAVRSNSEETRVVCGTGREGGVSTVTM